MPSPSAQPGPPSRRSPRASRSPQARSSPAARPGRPEGSAAADRLSRQHQRNVALVAGGVTSLVAAAALGADPMAIGTWFQATVDGLIARIQVGHAKTRRMTGDYLRRHAAVSGVRGLEIQTPSLDVKALRKRLEIVGPTGFKAGIAAGKDTDQALRTMATQMAGIADETVRDGDRDTIVETARRGKGVVGWRRRLSGRACGFCAMLASRGAVYTDRATAVIAKDGAAYHPHCHCWAEPLYWHQQEPPEVRALQGQWERVTAGHSGKDAQRVWRQHWEQKTTPRARQRMYASRSSSVGGGPVLPPGSPAQVRRILADAQTPEAVSRVLADEYERLTGRRAVVDLQGSVETAREHAEGILRVVERYPTIELREIGTENLLLEHAGYIDQKIVFDRRTSSLARREDYLGELGEDHSKGWHPFDNPVGTAVHEMGHALDVDNLGEAIRPQLREVLDRHGGASVAARKISGYATEDEAELVAEAFADVLTNGERASVVSRDIVDLLDAEYARRAGTTAAQQARRDLLPTKAGPRKAAAPAKKPAKAVAPKPPSAMTVTGLRKELTDAGVPADLTRGASQPQLARLAEIKRANPAGAATAAREARQMLVDARRELADALAEASELLGQQASAKALAARATSRLRQVERVAAGRPEALAAQKLAAAMQTGDAAAIKRAIAAAERSGGLKRVSNAAAVTRMDSAAMRSIGEHIPPGAPVRVVRPGYELHIPGDATPVRVPAQVERLTDAEFEAATRPRVKATTKKAAPAKAPAAKKAAPAKAAAKKSAAPKAKPAPEVVPPKTGVVDRTRPPKDVFEQEAKAKAAALQATPVKYQELPPTGRDAKALGYYQHRGDEHMNGLLRRGKVGKPQSWPKGKPLPAAEQVQANIDRIDAMMARSELTEDITVFRGMADVRRVFRGSDAPGSLVGRTFRDKGFVSTSADRSIAENFMAGEGWASDGVLMEIRVPRGTRAIQVSNDEFSGKAHAVSSEREILLDRGMRYRIVSDEMFDETYLDRATGEVRKTGQRYRHVVVEVIP